MFGTTSWRDPSLFCRSIASPKLTCSGRIWTGLPSTSVNAVFISGIAASALMIAYPIRWVNETLPPRPRFKWLLMTIRLSISNLAGIVRTLVAVGTARLASMLVAVRAAAPRNLTSSAPSGTGGGAGLRSGSFGAAGAGGLRGAFGGSTGFAGDGGAAALPFGAVGAALPVWGAPGEAGLPDAGRLSGRYSAKKFHQASSTELGSSRYFWYSSSTSHSLAPKSVIVGSALDCD